MRTHPGSRQTGRSVIGRLLLTATMLTVIEIGMCSGAIGTRVGLTTCYEAWDEKTTGLREVTSFVSVTAPIGPSMRLDMLAGHAAASGDNLGSASGLLNSRVRLSFTPRTSWAFRVGVSAPTGVTNLTDEELAVARVLTERVRGYRGYKLGEGTGFDVGVAYSFGIGPATFGMGAGYLIRGAYDVSTDMTDYDPGDQATFSLGVDVGDPRWLWRLDGIHIRYQADKLKRVEYFRVGPRFEARSSLTHRGDKTTTRIGFHSILHGRDEFAVADGMNAEEQNSNPKEFYCQFGLSRMVHRSLSLLLFGGGRVFQEAEDGTGAARRVDVGGGTIVRLSRAFMMTVRGGYSKAMIRQTNGGREVREDLELEGLLATISLEARL